MIRTDYISRCSAGGTNLIFIIQGCCEENAKIGKVCSEGLPAGTRLFLNNRAVSNTEMPYFFDGDSTSWIESTGFSTVD